MDIESTTDRADAIDQLGSGTSYNISAGAARRPTEKPTTWAKFKSLVVRRKAAFLIIILGALCFIAGIAVYFATIHNEGYILCCKRWINIHLVPHSHDDVGWLRTPEHYYEYSVKYILDHVVEELHRDPNRKFVYVETYFFWRWWLQQSNETQDSVRYLVHRGQLEFAGGGWSMNDEATPHYLDIIDQFTWGLRRLNDTFGERAVPKTGWQIDTFGHSREMASISALMGFEGLFFARIDEEERNQRRDQRAMEFLWNDRDGATSILTSIFFKHYNPPTGYHYEKEVNEGPNLDGFLELVREWADAYQTDNVLVPMGDDFTYYDAKSWFDNMDHLIRQVEERKGSGINVNMFYSTPLQYLEAIRNTATKWPVKYNGDFFPYGSDIFSYWSGYFTSRPTLKYNERIASNILQMMKQLIALVGSNPDLEDRLSSLREVIGVILHHDAITGTAKQAVTDHYMDLLHRAINYNIRSIADVLRVLSMKDGLSEPLPFEPCLLLNISACFPSERSAKFVVMAYNPLSWPVSRAVRLPVLANYYSVMDAFGNVVPSQIVPLPQAVISLPGRPSIAVQELVFQTGDIPAFGFKSFYVSIASSQVSFQKPNLSSKRIQLHFHKFTNHLSSITKDGQRIPIEQELAYYMGSSFWTGAYIFRPSDSYPSKMEGPVTNRLVADGDVVEETHQTFGPWASQVFRSYHNSPVLEIEWLVGPIPTEDYHGKEVIARYTSDIPTNGEFYTDTNGRGSLLRKRNQRDDWVYSSHEAISGNYYPVTTHISVRNKTSQMFVLTDRAQGGSSILDGQVELMVHRRLCYDDGKGVDEPLNETEFGEGLMVRGRHWLLIGNAPNLEQTAEKLSAELQNEPILLLSSTNLDYQTWQHSHLTSFTGLTKPLPPSVRMLTLEPWRDDLLLLRLEHMYEKNSAPPLSLPQTVVLKDMFSAFEIVAVRETKLAADRWASDYSGWLHGDLPVLLQPSSIRTYLVIINRR